MEGKRQKEYFMEKKQVDKKWVKLPVGIENFAKLRTEGFYYVDKTGLIDRKSVV